MPVLGSGHPQADIFLLKYSPRPSEVEEGVAFYGRSGNALMKSLKRLSIDPLAVYGTLCVKCPVPDPAMADPACVARLVEELAIVSPKIVVVMGPDALGDRSTSSSSRCGASCDPTLGEIQQLTPSIDALYVPEHRRLARRGSAKREFWARSGCSATGGRICRRTELAEIGARRLDSRHGPRREDARGASATAARSAARS